MLSPPSLVNPRILSGFALLLVAAGCSCDPSSTRTTGSTSTKTPVYHPKIAAVDDVWKSEIDALRHEQFIVELWDRLRASSKPLLELANLQFESVRIATLQPDSKSGIGIQRFIAHNSRTLVPTEFSALIKTLYDRGYRLHQSEWHHSEFQNDDQVPVSTFSFALDITRDVPEQRIVLRGNLIIEWRSTPNGESPEPRSIDATNVEALVHQGAQPFRLAASLEAKQIGATDFLAAYDLDGDGLSEILFGNRLFRNKGRGEFRAEQLARFRSAPLQSAALADFNGDGRVDLFCADPSSHPTLYLADNSGRFSEQPIVIRAASIREFSTSISAGDIDSDGDIDVWLTQYRRPYVGGQMPTPYYDANDGYPSYLLANDGSGHFSEVTADAGLDPKRNRRTYSSSLVDFDEDGDLDLLVVSDFAGIDLYRNDGEGRFQDVTLEMLEQRHTFGMSHVVADFNSDARLDFYVCGMGSTTARRLESMQAGPENQKTAMRQAMGYGNRMLLSVGNHFKEPTFRNQVARTGWSWGCGAVRL